MQLTGVKAHIWQRISAIYLALYFPLLFWQSHSINLLETPSFKNWIEQVFTPAFTLASLLAFGLLISHAWVGLRDIMIDYLPANRVRFWLWLYALFLSFICIDVIALIAWAVIPAFQP
ncbi:succinate dehydrogenase, hydrophobic membrane anchor protein [Thiomicrorhabdus immobilis]|uniref:Succinate dehydrogenase hydrophobic membrane anchor subunit n=1 Tax=Thiomicrorhabdus immobilis TaxID=2791037 RepID=A0ABM7MCX9_9GAMM|nr:succinate dehydrogenase, hydrophobic membrane anchor protein [Thiomicrorhabdus immobilis]BCN93271.1 succinate dehydrogenase, hydrophobic membrane anchor protein [Thiomicrorhabdus immobilis]